MLILTRKIDEAIIIKLPEGEQIYIFVAKVNGNQVRLAIDAPSEVGIRREELLYR